MCIYAPARGERKCEVIWVIGEPSALRESIRTNTPRCSIFGMIFSMPTDTMCSFGRCTDRSALPSLVHTTMVPVSATAKLAPVSPASAARKCGTRRPALALGEVVHVVVLRVGAERSGEHRRDVGAQLVHGRYHDVARRLVVQLLDPLAEIRLDHRDVAPLEVRAHLALVGQHRLGLHQRARAAVAKQVEDDLVVLGGVSREVDLGAVVDGVAFEFLEVVVEVAERVLLDGGRDRPQLLPLGKRFVVSRSRFWRRSHSRRSWKLGVVLGLDELRRGLGVVDPFHALLQAQGNLRVPRTRPPGGVAAFVGPRRARLIRVPR